MKIEPAHDASPGGAAILPFPKVRTKDETPERQEASQEPAVQRESAPPMPAEPATAPAPAEPAATPAPAAAAPAIRPIHLAAAYIFAAVMLSLAQGLGLNFISANLTQIQGSFGATTNEANWLMAAYMAPNASLTLILFKVRAQYGLRSFAEVSIIVFVGVSLVHLFVNDFQSALVLRFFAGAAASPMSSLGFLYMLEAFPPQRKMTFGLCTALANMSIAAPIARIISPPLLDIGGWHALYVLEVAFAIVALACVFTLRLTPVPRAKVISLLDVVSYLFIAIGFGAMAVSLSVGRLYWWTEVPWLGVLLAVSIAAMTIAAVIELNRKSPFIDVRWLSSREVLHFTAVLIVFRVALSEQTTGAIGLFTALGLSPAQTSIMWFAILAASVGAGLLCGALMKPGREAAIHAVALVLIGIGAYLDSQSTSITRPEEMIVSQMLIAAGGALFLPPALSAGLTAALRNGPQYIFSFIIVFLTTQSLGALFGSALLGSFITIREKFHSSYLVEHLSLTDPLVAQRINLLASVYGKVLTDKTLLNAEGAALLSQTATREATVLAYNDLFLGVAVLCAAALLGLIAHSLFKTLYSVTAPATTNA